MYCILLDQLIQLTTAAAVRAFLYGVQGAGVECVKD